MALEFNGDLYSCDHFVEPKFLIGNIMKTPMIELVTSEKQGKFGQDKFDTLPQFCRNCEFLRICNGECPKNRFVKTPDGEFGLNYLCEGYKNFFKHADPYMRIMAKLIQSGRTADGVMKIVSQENIRGGENFAAVGRNDPCPCGSGLKFKRCHGNNG